jgi:hypothetical protein
MARASYQKIDNIRLGTKPVNVKLHKKNNKSVTVCLAPPNFHNTPKREGRPVLHLKY